MMQEKTGVQRILEWLLLSRSHKLLCVTGCLCISMCMMARAGQAEIPASVIVAVNKIADMSLDFKRETYRFTDSEYKQLRGVVKKLPVRRRIPYSRVWYEKEPRGVVLWDKVKGKFDWIYYWVWVDSNDQIMAVRIYKHHENRGKRISSKSWLRQFVGIKSVQSNLLNDIDDVTGATVSSGAVVLGVQRSLEYFKIVSR